MDLSIIIPCLNESQRLPPTLQAMALFLQGRPEQYEIIVVDDGSSDDTSAVARAHASLFGGRLRVLRFEDAQGKGHAVKHGMLAATGAVALFMDADHATPLSELPKLMSELGTHDVVIGSRHVAHSQVLVKQPLRRRLIGRGGNYFIRALLLPGINDTQCGFKLFSRRAYRDIFPRQQLHRYGFDVEILSIAHHAFGYKIKEVPVVWHDAPDSRLGPWRDAFTSLYEVMKIKYYLRQGRYH